MHNSEFEAVYSEMLPFWSSISADEQHILCSSSIAVKYAKGETVHDGGNCSGLFFVRSGCLRVYMMSEEGKEVTLYRLHRGDMCMLSASCVIRAITFDVFIDSEEESECFVIGSSAFESVVESNPDVKIFSLELAVSRFSEVMWAMQQILFMSMDKRLAIFLSDESSRMDSDTIPLTHEQIAKYMGSAREVVTRMLKYFASEGIVEVSRKGIKILDKKRLRELALQH